MTAQTGLPWGRPLTVTVLGLEDDRYVERASVTGRDSCDVAAPFEVGLCPWDLTRDLRAD